VSAYGRELRKSRGSREAGQVPTLEDTWSFTNRESSTPSLRLMLFQLANAALPQNVVTDSDT
jgi:hypothetical protein